MEMNNGLGLKVTETVLFYGGVKSFQVSLSPLL